MQRAAALMDLPPPRPLPTWWVRRPMPCVLPPPTPLPGRPWPLWACSRPLQQSAQAQTLYQMGTPAAPQPVPVCCGLALRLRA